MKIVVMGAGGVGGYFGARLADSGQDVTFIARGPHLEAMRRQGLRVLSPLGDLELPSVHAVGDPAAAGTADLVLLCTKSYDLDSAGRSLLPLLGADTIVLPLLNGIDIADRLGPIVGTERLLAGLCQIATAIEEPGVIRHSDELQRIVFGEPGGGITPRGEALLAAIQDAGIGAELSAAIDVPLWSKFIFLAPMAGVCCVTGQTIGPVLAEPDTRAMIADCIAEIEAVARAKNIALPHDVAASTLSFLDGRPLDTKPSMLLDQERGKTMEVESINGAVADLGESLGIAMPVNRFINTALKIRARGNQ